MRTGFVSVNGLRLRFLVAGEAHDRDVLLLHGRTSSAETWREVADRLARRRRVVALEQRGHGQSDWSPAGEYNLAEFLGDLEEFAARELRAPFDLVGHSMGACTSLVYTARHPASVRRLVLEDGGPPGETVLAHTRSLSKELPDRFATWDEADAFLADWYGPLGFEVTDGRRRFFREEHGRIGWVPDMPGLLSERHRSDDLFLNGQWDAVEQLRTPTLVLQATEPPLLLAPDVTERMARMNPLIAVKPVPGARHGIHVSQLEAFLAEVERFLDESQAGTHASGSVSGP